MTNLGIVNIEKPIYSQYSERVEKSKLSSSNVIKEVSEENVSLSI